MEDWLTSRVGIFIDSYWETVDGRGRCNEDGENAKGSDF